MTCIKNPTFTKALKNVLGIEGDFSDHPDDPGGKTRWGITEEVARKHGYDGPMRCLPIANAKKIYFLSYWRPAGCDEVQDHSPDLAEELFEAAVNLGVGRVVGFLQMGLNALNRQERDWNNIAVDGAFGPMTRAAFGSCCARRGKPGMAVLKKTVNGCQLWHYLSLAQDDSQFETFYFGWVYHRI